MANAEDFRGQTIIAGALNLSEQTSCPIPSGQSGMWNDAGVMKIRQSDGTDTTVASGEVGGALRAHAVATDTLANITGGGITYAYANGTLGVGATLTASGNGAFPTVDGVAAALNNLYLVTAQAAAAQNGYYKLTQLGAVGVVAILTRAEEFDQSAEMKDGTAFVIRGGTVNADTLWRFTGADSPTVGTTSLTFERDPLVVTTNTAQTISGIKTHSVALYANAGVDRSAAAALALGGTNASAVDVSKSGSTTTIKGGLTVDEASNLNGDVNLGNAATDTITPVGVVDGNLTFIKEVNRSILVDASTTGATAGANLSVASGNGNGAAGGNMNVDTGSGTVGGNLNLGTVNAAQVTAGNATSTTNLQGTAVDVSQGAFSVALGTTLKQDGTGTGAVALRFGATTTEGWEIRVFDDVISPAAVETNVVNVPANSIILSVQANVQAALTGGGTTVTWSLGVAADPDKYGTHGWPTQSDSLAQNGKSDWLPTAYAHLSSAEQIVLTGAAAGGAADGDTALTVGSVRVRVVYQTLNSLDNA